MKLANFQNYLHCKQKKNNKQVIQSNNLNRFLEENDISGTLPDSLGNLSNLLYLLVI